MSKACSQANAGSRLALSQEQGHKLPLESRCMWMPGPQCPCVGHLDVCGGLRIVHAGESCLATSMTTALSFFANLASALQPLREFGTAALSVPVEPGHDSMWQPFGSRLRPLRACKSL